ncbi:hypothetical protein ACN6MT_10345 [Neobacillus niacini]|uniref:glucosamine inositolphosphorylceramide transferase family protein n=1 Tax=Neobacillus niacini TaxID=86668 RepID=UPI003B027F3F
MGIKRLRFGVVCDNINVEGWQLNSIRKMLDLEFVEAGLIILINSNQSKQIFGRNTYVRKTNLTSIMKNITILECDSVTSVTDDNHFSEKDLKKINGFELDFLLNLYEGNLGGEITKLPRFGVWSFQHCSNLPQYFWEIYNDQHVTFASLNQISHENILLKKGCFSIIKDSYKKNKLHITSVISEWPARVCQEILNNHSAYMRQGSIAAQPPKFMKPTSKQMGGFLGKLLINKCKKVFSKLFSYEYWNIGIVPKPIHEVLNDSNVKIKWIFQKKDLYYADPFAYQEEGGLRILMEELDYKVVKGYISGLNVKKNVGWDIVTFNQAMLKFPCHMSYPFILEHENEVYCIPETSEVKEASIYQLNKSSKEWKKVKTLIKGFHAVDSTIVKHGDLWWLFCTKSFSTIQSHNNELHIFYADELFGEWKPHCLNPVKIDIRSSRPAGTPFVHEGNLYRPAQDCSKTYGGRIVLNKIKTLTISEFEEESVSFVEPQSDSLYPDGVHTLSSVGGVTLIDGKRFDYSLFHFFRKLYKFRPVKDIKQVNSSQLEKGTTTVDPL